MTLPVRAAAFRSPAKLNLFLEVLNRRPDGYHAISTLFQEISLADTLRVRIQPGGALAMSTDSPDLPVDEGNLVLRAARAFKERYPEAPGFAFHLSKRIPIGAGLGGGSGNAAAALKACAMLTGAAVRGALGTGSGGAADAAVRGAHGTGSGRAADASARGGLLPLAKRLGADVPFFLRGGLAAAGGIGDRLTFFSPASRRTAYFVLIFPRVFSSTPAAYKALRFPLTKRHSRLKLTRALRDGAPPGRWAPWLFNRLEEAVLPRLRPVELAKRALVQAGCLNALMTGSGASVFGVVDSAAHGRRVIARLRREPWDFWLVRSVP